MTLSGVLGRRMLPSRWGAGESEVSHGGGCMGSYALEVPHSRGDATGARSGTPCQDVL